MNFILSLLRNKLINCDEKSIGIIYRMFIFKNIRETLRDIPGNFWDDVVNNGIIVKEHDSTFVDDYISYTYEPWDDRVIPTIIYYRNLQKSYIEDMILDVLSNKKILIDFLGYNESDIIIDRILCNDELLDQLRSIPVSFWNDALDGLLLYSEYTSITKNKKSLSLDYKYQNFYNNSKSVPALVYQKKKNFRY